MANLLRASGLRLVQSPVIPFDTPGLEDGIRFAYVHAGTLVYDLGMFVPTAFDGTSPFADVGIFQGGDTAGFFAAMFGVNDLTNADGDIVGHPVVGAASQWIYHWGAYAAANVLNGPFRITTAGPLYVVVSQDGTKGGTPVGGAAGELVAWALLAG